MIVMNLVSRLPKRSVASASKLGAREERFDSLASDEFFGPEWDLARVAIAAQRQDVFLKDLIELAEDGFGSAVGILVNGMVAVGTIASPEAIAEELDRQRARVASRSTQPEGQSKEEWDKSVELFSSANMRAVDQGRREREELRDSGEGPWDFSAPVKGRARDALELEARYNLTLVQAQVVAPGQPGVLRPPVLRISMSQINGWWPVPTDENGHASFQIFSTDPS